MPFPNLTKDQIQAAKENATRHGVKNLISDQVAIAYLDWRWVKIMELETIVIPDDLSKDYWQKFI